MMKRALALISGLLICLMAHVAVADELDRFKGKWTGKTDFQGADVEMTLEIDGSKVTFDMGGFIVGTAKVTLTSAGGFRMLSFTEVQAGESLGSLNAVDADSKHVYSFGYRSFTLASNFDDAATEDPKLTIYKKVD